MPTIVSRARFLVSNKEFEKCFLAKAQGDPVTRDSQVLIFEVHVKMQECGFAQSQSWSSWKLVSVPHNWTILQFLSLNSFAFLLFFTWGCVELAYVTIGYCSRWNFLCCLRVLSSTVIPRSKRRNKNQLFLRQRFFSKDLGCEIHQKQSAIQESRGSQRSRDAQVEFLKNFFDQNQFQTTTSEPIGLS